MTEIGEKDWKILSYENVRGMSCLIVSNHLDIFCKLRFICCDGAYPYDFALFNCNSWSYSFLFASIIWFEIFTTFFNNVS